MFNQTPSLDSSDIDSSYTESQLYLDLWGLKKKNKVFGTVRPRSLMCGFPCDSLHFAQPLFLFSACIEGCFYSPRPELPRLTDSHVHEAKFKPLPCTNPRSSKRLVYACSEQPRGCLIWLKMHAHTKMLME